jgi:drug/metabolite transporter (DMT)-like permease
MTIEVDGAVPPRFLRRLLMAVTTLTGLAAGVAIGAVVLTALFGGEGESPVALAVIGVGVAVVIILHAAALGRLLLRRRQHWLSRNAVFLGGVGLLVVSGAVIVGAELDDAPGGVLAGLLLAMQGGAAVLTVAFPQLVPPRTSSA